MCDVVVVAGFGLGVDVAKQLLFRLCLSVLQAALSQPRIGKHQTVHGRHAETLCARLKSASLRLMFMPCKCDCLIFISEASHQCEVFQTSPQRSGLQVFSTRS